MWIHFVWPFNPTSSPNPCECLTTGKAYRFHTFHCYISEKKKSCYQAEKKVNLICCGKNSITIEYPIKGDFFFSSSQRVFMKSQWDQPGSRGKSSHQNSLEHLFSSRPSAEQCTNAVLFYPFSLVALPAVRADRAAETCGFEG